MSVYCYTSYIRVVLFASRESSLELGKDSYISMAKDRMVPLVVTTEQRDVPHTLSVHRGQSCMEAI